MKLINPPLHSDELYSTEMFEFETVSGCKITRERLKSAISPAPYSLELKGWSNSRQLFELTEFDKEHFPQAQWRIALTPHYEQWHPLFQTAPCWINPGTKHQLMIKTCDDLEPVKVQITHRFF